MATLRITQVKSSVSRPSDQRRTLHALGLKKIRQTVEKPDRPEIRGMVNKVIHLVEVEEIGGATPLTRSGQRGVAQN
jgi:large subunit ribosomal protein L30